MKTDEDVMKMLDSVKKSLKLGLEMRHPLFEFSFHLFLASVCHVISRFDPV